MDRSKDATPQQIRRAREEGRIAVSNDLAHALSLMGSIAVLFYCGPEVCQALQSMFVSSWTNFETNVDQFDFGALMSRFSAVGVWLLLFAFVSGLTVIASRLVQIGPLFRPNLAAPNLQRLDAGRWFRQVFSLNTLFHQSLIGCKIGAVIAVGWLFAQKFEHFQSRLYASLPLQKLLVVIHQRFFGILAIVVMGMLMLGIVDLWQRRKNLARSVSLDVNENNRNIRAILPSHEKQTSRDK